MHLVDTSVLISYLSGRRTQETIYLSRLEQQGTPYAIPSICLQEVLQGAKDEKSWKTLKQYLSMQIIIAPMDQIVSYEESARIYYELKKKGITVRSSSDCLIAQIVLENEGILLHKDIDFKKIKHVRKLELVDF
jgi:predicted nucleic acid-binding protein